MRPRWVGGIGALVGIPMLAYGVASLVARPVAAPPIFAQLTNRPLVIAHRGGEGLWPRNTLFAFKNANAMGVDMLEMDIHASADGVIVVRHNDTVDSTTESSGLVKEMTLAELQKLDAGYTWTDDAGASFPFRGRGITIPTLEEVFTALPAMPMTIEIKQAEPSLASTLCDLIRRHHMENQVIIGSFHNAALDEFRQLCPKVATSGHQNDVRTFVYLSKLRLTRAYTPRTAVLQVPQRHDDVSIVTRRSVQDAHARGMQVHVWTVNEEADMAALIDLAVDGIITDRPDRLMALLARSQE